MPGEIWLSSLLFHSSENIFSIKLCDIIPVLALSYFAKVWKQTFMVKDPFNVVFLSLNFLDAFYFMKNQNPHCCSGGFVTHQKFSIVFICSRPCW